ncbi:hypothetical protein BBFGKLBO_01238 [Synechococcus sp. CBW1107]|uniref:ComEC/Rec2 family competence protein n=1 Tax=Synechococcus sp. CBW1107 TaxID=2789857 RepID=UPI002AD4A5B1|nr:ComEC/Rec2 family competence protein [Synechococcus sp. CBW1107]CAK6692457.1 hypothetical protein BBFGKLBO_01238 [Synechococcus sp. CBW1107]
MPFLVVSLALAGLALGTVPLAAAPRLALLLLLGAAGWWRARRLGARPLPALALLVIAPSLLLWALWRQPHPGPADPVQLLQGLDGRELVLRGQLSSDPRLRGDSAGCSVPLRLAGGSTELQLQPCPPLRQGWLVEAHGILRRPASGPHPLLSGPAERLARRGIWSQLRLGASTDLKVLARPATPIADLRRRMAATLIRQGGERRGGILAALVLGSAVVPLPADVAASFRAAGLSHALAASGFHLSVLLGAVMALGRRLPRPPRCALALGAMLLFLLLAGPQPSVVRAVLMGGVAFAVLESGGRSRPLGVLLLSVLLMLLVQPWWLQDVGFQLSVAATAGLILTARPLETALAGRLPAWAAAGLAVPVAASLWTLPLQLHHFGIVPLYAVPANLLVAPLLSPLTLGAMALALSAVLLPPLVPLLAWPLLPLSGLLLAITRAIAALPMAQWQLGRPLPALVLLFGLSLLPWLLPGAGAWPRRLGAAGLALVLAVHLALLGGDALLLVHRWSGDLLVARHRGRGALVSGKADGLSCSDARKLASGLGMERYDWITLLDPVAPDDPACWSGQTSLLVSSSAGQNSLQPGQRLESPGLSLAPLSGDSQALALGIGRHRWWLLPDPQSLEAWSHQGPAGGEPVAGVWLGFRPSRRQQRQLSAAGPRQVWLSGEAPGLPQGWSASGASGSLQGAPG